MILPQKISTFGLELYSLLPALQQFALFLAVSCAVSVRKFSQHSRFELIIVVELKIICANGFLI